MAYVDEYQLDITVESCMFKLKKRLVAGPKEGVKFLISDAGDFFTEESKKLKAAGGVMPKAGMTAEELAAAVPHSEVWDRMVRNLVNCHSRVGNHDQAAMLAALAPAPSFGGYVLWTLASMLHHVAEVVLRILVGVMMFAYALPGWSALGAGAALLCALQCLHALQLGAGRVRAARWRRAPASRSPTRSRCESRRGTSSCRGPRPPARRLPTTVRL